MDTVLVVGNGESRLNLDISSFQDSYDVIGCNAIHRETQTDHLVCCDKRMVEEAIISPNTEHTKIWVRPDWYRYFRKIKKDKRINLVPVLPYTGESKQDDPIHWGSGPYAVLLGANMYSTIMLVGFDLYGINGKINNVYKNTKNYHSSDANAVDYSYWVYQISKVFQNYPDKEFIIWNNPNWTLPNSWKLKNVHLQILSEKVA